MAGSLAGLNPCLHRAMPLQNRRDFLAVGWAGWLQRGQPKAGVQPEVTRLNDESIRAAAQYAAAHQTTQLLIEQQGRRLWHSGASSAACRIYSGTKGFWGLAALAAQQDGLLNLDESAAAALPQWQNDPRRIGITLRQLLDMDSGLAPCFELHRETHSDRNAHAMAAAQVARPGKAFIYGPGGLQVFVQVLEQRLHRGLRKRSAIEYLEKRVLRPLGLGPQRHLPDAKGRPLLATGFVMTALQWAALGRCLLADGAPILKPGALEQIRQGQHPNSAFSLGFWNNRSAANRLWRGRAIDIEAQLEEDWPQQDWRRVCLCREAPADLLASIGSRHQRLYVLPSQQLLVVRQSLRDGGFQDAAFLRLLLDARP